MFSIVIPLYNKENSIHNSIQSVLRQTYNNFEVIIIDDGSTDNSLYEVKKYSDSRIRVYTVKNGGVSLARNIGISKCNNPYIAFLDADDYWNKDYLYEMKKLINKYPNASLYGCAQNIKREEYISKSRISSLSTNFEGYIRNYFQVALSGTLFHTSACIVDRSILINNQIQFNTSLVKGEDLLFYFELAKLKYPVCFSTKALTVYDMTSENRAMSKYTPFYKRLIGLYSDKKLLSEEENTSYRVFISNYIVSCLGLLYYEQENKELIETLKQNIVWRDLTLKRKILYFLPKSISKYIYSKRFIKL